MRGPYCDLGTVLVTVALAGSAGVVPAKAAGSSPGMTGRFVARGGAVRVKSRPSPGDFTVALIRDTGQCTGALSSRGRGYLSNTLTFSAADPASGTTCTVDLLYAPDFQSLDVKESAACLVWHGAGCTFEGTYRRQF